MATGFISVRTKEGTPKFRRGDRSFTREPVVLREEDLTEEQRKAIREEPMLEVEELSEQEALKRGVQTDGRLPLEKAYGDYPPPGQSTSGVAEPPENPNRPSTRQAGDRPPGRPAGTRETRAERPPEEGTKPPRR